MHVLHDEPIDCLAVFAEDPGCFDQFGSHAGDGVGVGVGVEVECYCVDHFGWCGGVVEGVLGEGGNALGIELELEEMLEPRVGLILWYIELLK
jgi:hypothetical protein